MNIFDAGGITTAIAVIATIIIGTGITIITILILAMILPLILSIAGI